MSVTPTLIGEGSKTSSTSSVVINLTVGASAGDDVWVIVDNIAKPVQSVSDSAGGNTWDIVTTENAGGNTAVSLLHCTLTNALSSSGTITPEWSALGTCARASGFAFKLAAGTLVSGTADQIATPATAASSTAISVGATATLAQADEFVILAVGINEGSTTGKTVTWGTGYTQIDSTAAESGTSNHKAFGAYLETSSTAGVTGTGTISATPTRWVGVLATYKVASGAVSGTAAGPSTSSGTATGSATDHLVSGTAAGNTPSLASAAGTITRHLITGGASNSTPSAGAATGSASTHAVHGVGSGATAAPGAAAGTITRHLITGSADGTTTSAGAATGAASAHAVHGTASGATAAPATASGTASTHTVSGSASGSTPSSGAAIGSEATLVDSWLWWWRRRWR